MELLELKFSDEGFEKIMNAAACNFSPEKVAMLLDVDKKAFLKLWYDKTSDVRQAYDGGQLKAQFNVMDKQRELGESGNITAAQTYLKERKEIENASIRDRILFGNYVD